MSRATILVRGKSLVPARPGEDLFYPSLTLVYSPSPCVALTTLLTFLLLCYGFQHEKMEESGL